ncbi:MAG TPA: DMT family transporter [Pseudomonadales bacterium]
MVIMNGEPLVRRDRMDTFGAGILIGFNVLLGLNQALVKLVNAGFSPVFQAGLRSACAFLPVLLYALWARKRLSLTDGTLVPGVINGLLFSGEFCLLFLALDLTSVSRVSLFFYTMPLWLAVASHFLIPGERLNGIKAAGLVVAFSGIALALLSGKRDPDSESWLGDLIALAAALCWGGIALLARTTRLQHTSPEMNLLYQLAVSAVVVIPLALLMGDTIREPTAALLGIFAFQVIVVVAIGFVVWFWILSVYPVASMASFSLLTPLFGIFFGWWIFDDALPPSFLGALGLVGIGLVLVNRG